MSDFQVTDDVTDNEASYHNRILPGISRSEFHNTVTMSATLELADSDTPIQELDPNGANRVCELPPESTTTNHHHFIKNTGSGGFSITIKDDSGTTTFCTLANDEWCIAWPADSTWHVLYSGNIGGGGASSVSITDSGGYFSGSDVEAALQEVGLTEESGWMEISDSWSYATASTITVPSDATTKYSPYMRVRFKQGGGYKYYVIRSVAATTLTVAINDDYVVANSAITNIAVSHLDVPLDFPMSFGFTPSWTNFTTTDATIAIKYSIAASGLVHIFGYVTFGASTAITGSPPSFGLPISHDTYSVTYAASSGLARYQDVGTNQYYGITTMLSDTLYFNLIDASSTYATTTGISSTTPFTWASTDMIIFNTTYQGV